VRPRRKHDLAPGSHGPEPDVTKAVRSCLLRGFPNPAEYLVVGYDHNRNASQLVFAFG